MIFSAKYQPTLDRWIKHQPFNAYAVNPSDLELVAYLLELREECGFFSIGCTNPNVGNVITIHAGDPEVTQWWLVEDHNLYLYWVVPGKATMNTGHRFDANEFLLGGWRVSPGSWELTRVWGVGNAKVKLRQPDFDPKVVVQARLT